MTTHHPHPTEVLHPPAVKGVDRDPKMGTDPPGEGDRNHGSHHRPGQVRSADEGESGAEESEEEDDHPGLDYNVCYID